MFKTALALEESWQLTPIEYDDRDEAWHHVGHHYITLFVDVHSTILLFATEGKGKDSLARSKPYLLQKDVKAVQIQEICCDMSVAFIRGIEEQFPTTEITLDKFHVMKTVNEASKLPLQ